MPDHTKNRIVLGITGNKWHLNVRQKHVTKEHLKHLEATTQETYDHKLKKLLKIKIKGKDKERSVNIYELNHSV